MGTPAEGSTKKDINISKLSLSEKEGKDSEFPAHKISPRQWITMVVLVYVNLINYMDRLTLAGEVTTLCVSGIDFRSSQGR